VPIREVAEALGLRLAGNMVHCWRPENHKNGDRTPSVGLQQRRNKAKCFVCDALPLSPIDLVMSVLRLDDLREAGQWFTSRYDVPAAPKGKHIEHSERWPERFRVGTGSAVEMLVRSGIWASLTPAQRSLVPVLQTFADSQTDKVKISYRGMMRYAGVRSQSTVSIALKRFRALCSFASEPTGIGTDCERVARTDLILMILNSSNSPASACENTESRSNKSVSLGKTLDERE